VALAGLRAGAPRLPPRPVPQRRSGHGGDCRPIPDKLPDVSDRTPREISRAELEACDYVATMGCSTLSLDADTDVRDWALNDPDGEDLDAVRAIRDDIEGRVAALFDEIEPRL